MKRKPDIRDMEMILERIRRDKAKTDNPNPDLPKAAPTTSFRPKEVYSGPTKETVEPDSQPEAVEPVEDIPVAVPTTQRKPVDDNRGNLFLPDIPKGSAKTLEPETPSIPKSALSDFSTVERKAEYLTLLSAYPEDAIDFARWAVWYESLSDEEKTARKAERGEFYRNQYLDNQPATEKQIRYLRHLGWTGEVKSKLHVSELIERIR